MCVREFQSELWLPLPPAELFPFFADVANLGAITPSVPKFEMLTPRASLAICEQAGQFNG
jgi:hypothetical protein